MGKGVWTKVWRAWRASLLVLKNWKFIAIFMFPFLLIWLCFTKDEYMKYLFILMICGMYWMFDCMPLPATGLIPLILFPLLTLQNAKDTMKNYMKDVTMMTFGCSLLALSVISSGLSKRIALNILFLTRANFRLIMLYLMMTSALFSMWFVNTAVMIFMMKVIEEIITELKDNVGVGTLGDQKMEEWNKTLELDNGVKMILDEQGESNLPEGESNAETELQNQVVDSPDNSDLKAPKKSEENPDSTAIASAAVPSVQDASSSATIGTAVSMLNPDKSEQQNLHSEGMDMDNIKQDIAELLTPYKIDLFHSVAIAANIGGLLWPYTSTSSVALYHFSGIPAYKSLARFVNLAVWMNFTFPIILIVFTAACIYMGFINFGPWQKIFQKNQLQYMTMTAANCDTKNKVQNVYRDKCKALGKLNSHEKGALFVVILSIFLFLLRRPVFMWGWTALFTKKPKLDIKDSTVASLITVLAFFIPKCGADMLRGPKNPDDKASFTAVLGWKIIQQSFPWGLLIFIGGATSLAEGMVQIDKKDTAFAMQLDTQLYENFGPTTSNSRQSSNPALVLLISMLITSALSHFVTNTAGAVIAAKIFGTLSYKLNFGYCYLAVPCLAVCSFSFLLPAGTPTMALAHMKCHELDGWVCFRKGWPLFVFAFTVVYFFGLFYTDSLMNCGS